MPTPWTYPNAVAQYTDADVHAHWMNVNEDFEYENLNSIRTEKEIYHIANSFSNDRRNKTYYLVFKDFQFENLPDVVSGIELYVNIRRTGRITDDTIRLHYNEPIGENLAEIALDDIKHYGSPTTTWGGLTFTTEQLLDPEFGVVLRYQSHPSYPHSTTAYLQHVQMRIW
jgi:hypothetical protein